MPPNRMYSSPWLRRIHFSPRIPSTPFGITSATVTVIEPARVFCWLDVAPPSKSRSALREAPQSERTLPPILGAGTFMLLFLLMLVLAFLLDWVRSSNTTVRMSPIR